jgi:hypothetical protein
LLANRRLSLSVRTALITDLEHLGAVQARRDVIALATATGKEDERPDSWPRPFTCALASA